MNEHSLVVKINTELKDALELAAKNKGLTVAGFVRSTLIDIVKQ